MTEGEGKRTVEEHVRAVLAEHEVVLFVHGPPPDPRCRFSRRAISLVDAHREEYEVVDVLGNADAYRSVLREFGGWETTPQVYVDGDFVGDADVLASLADREALASTLGSRP